MLIGSERKDSRLVEVRMDSENMEAFVLEIRNMMEAMTLDKVDTPVRKLLELKLDPKDERVTKMANLFFEVAVDGTQLGPNPMTATIAALVRKLSVARENKELAKRIRKLILDQCQREFQQEITTIKDLKTKLAIAASAEESQKELNIEENRTAMRRRALENIRFIGELYKLQMLTPQIVVECVGMLLGEADDESLECICVLLKTTGQRLMEDLQEIELKVQTVINKKGAKGVPEKYKFKPESDWMNKTITALEALTFNSKLSRQTRIAILEFCELRDRAWSPKVASEANGEMVERVCAPKAQQGKRPKRRKPPKAQKNQITATGSSAEENWRSSPLQLKTG